MRVFKKIYRIFLNKHDNRQSNHKPTKATRYSTDETTSDTSKASLPQGWYKDPTTGTCNHIWQQIHTETRDDTDMWDPRLGQHHIEITTRTWKCAYCGAEKIDQSEMELGWG